MLCNLGNFENLPSETQWGRTERSDVSEVQHGVGENRAEERVGEMNVDPTFIPVEVVTPPPPPPPPPPPISVSWDEKSVLGYF